MQSTHLTRGRAGEPAGFPALGLATAAAGLMLGALAVGERSGLPGAFAWPIGFAFLALAAAAVMLASRTAEEPVFLGRYLLARPIGGGLLLGALAAGACFHLLRPAGSGALVATALGAATGLAIAHVTARLRQGSQLLVGEAARGEEGAPSLIQGLLTAGAGLMLALAALPTARDSVTKLADLSPTAALSLVVLAPVAAIATGGMRGLLALAAVLSLFLAAALAATLWLGLVQLGGLPLPGFTPQDTLLAIASARTRLFQSDALPFVVAWMPPDGFVGIVFSLPFVVAAAVSALIARALSPGVPVSLGATLAAAAAGQALMLLGLAAMAGYAVEAAGLQFVGASLQKPPPGLLEASRQGLAEFCGARPTNLDELRAACGLAPRAQGQLVLERVRLMEPFLWTGTPVAFGLPSALATPARLGPLVFPSLAVAAGIWLMAQGLGRGVFGRGRIAPGLASHRLGLVRLAAFVSAVALALAVRAGLGASGVWQAAALLALMVLGLDVIQQGFRPPRGNAQSGVLVQRAAISRNSAAPRNTAQSA
jgi:hypothetical protein